MRKQYHFRLIDNELWAWDIDRLILLTKDIEVENIPMNTIAELDEAYWYSNKNEIPTCRSIADHMRLVQSADLSYPIIVCPEGKVMDGMHRVLKALLDGHHFIRAYRLAAMPAPDYVGVEPDDLPYGNAPDNN